MLRSNKIGILNDRMTDRPIAEFFIDKGRNKYPNYYFNRHIFREC